MDKRAILKNIYFRNLLGLILVSILLTVAVLIWMNHYTQHGKSVEVPDVKGLSVEKATPFFTGKKLNYLVIDSVFIKNAVPGSIAETTPEIGTMVKMGRVIYLKIISRMPPLITLPDVKNTSQRQALAILRSLGFEKVEIKTVPGAYMDLALGLESKGIAIAAGQRVSADTPLSLLVSSGSSDIVTLDNPVDSGEVNLDESWF